MCRFSHGSFKSPGRAAIESQTRHSPSPSSTFNLSLFLFGTDGNTLAAWVKVFAVIGVFLYGLGTVVSNEYLAQLYASNFAWPGPQAIFTGTWSVVLIAASVLLPITPWGIIYFTKSIPSKARPALALVGYLVFSVATVGTVCVLFSNILKADMSKSLRWGAFLFFRPAILGQTTIAAMTIICYSLIKYMKEETATIVTIGIFSLVLSYTLFVLPSFYAVIPVGHGGGHPLRVRLVLNKSGAALLTDLCSEEQSSESIVSGPAELLYETSSDYWITLTPAAKTPFSLVKITKGSVDGLRFLEPDAQNDIGTCQYQVGKPASAKSAGVPPPIHP